MIIPIVAFLGLLLSIYALSVHLQGGQKKAVCDIHHRVSCTKAFTSKYGSVFGMPNPAIGIVFYLLVIGLFYSASSMIVYPTVLAVLFSLYLAYVSFFIQRNMCVVCMATYAINIGILLLSV